MSRNVLYGCIGVILGLSQLKADEWVSFGGVSGDSVTVNVLGHSDTQTIVEFTIPGMWVRDTIINGTLYQVVTLPGEGTLTDTGKPQLPTANRIVAISPTKCVALSILETDCDTLSEYYIYPAQKQAPIGEVDTGFIIDTAFYQQDASCPGETANASSPMIWRDYRVVQIRCNPVQFNPVEKKLKVFLKVKIALNYSGTDTLNILTSGPKPTCVFDQMYKSHIINYDFIASKSYLPDNGSYLIITHDDFYDKILPFAEWKHKRGIPTTVISLSGSPVDSATIHNCIKDAYSGPNALDPQPDWVLLVGDVEYLMPGRRQPSQPSIPWAPTDHCYSLIEGNDILSEINIGRFAVDVGECDAVVNKLIKYEKDPYLGEVAWYKSYTGVVGACAMYHNSHFLPLTKEMRNILNTYTYTTEILDIPPPTQVSSSINDGRSVVSWYGHGFIGIWASNVNFDLSHVNNLVNGRKLPMVFGWSCLTNHFIGDGDEFPGSHAPVKCMGEAFLNQEQGGIGYFGATDDVWPDYIDAMIRGTWPGIWVQHHYNVGVACNDGKIELYNQYPYREHEQFVFNLLGDPSLEIWTRKPRRMWANHCSWIVAYPGLGSIIRVQVIGSTSPGLPLPGALVCLWKEGEVYQRKITDDRGICEFGVIVPTTGKLYVTVTKHNYRPYEEYITVKKGKHHGGTTWLISSDTTICGWQAGIDTFKIVHGVAVDIIPSDGSDTTGMLAIQANVINIQGTLSGDMAGYAGGEGPGAGTEGSKNYGAGGAGYGGRGGDGKGGKAGGSAYADSVFGNPGTYDWEMGSGGGNSGISAYKGGAGGGRIKLDSPTGSIIIDGTISTNGGSGNGWGAGAYTSGGGSGGSIWLDADLLAGGGTISANGGNGYDAGWSDAGGGAGGRVHIKYGGSSFNGGVSVNGGDGPDKALSGQMGSIWIEQKDGLVNIGISSVDTGGTRSSPEGSITGVEFKRENVNLPDNSTILGNIYIKADNSIVIASGASITASSKGYHPSEGPGAGTDGSKNYGAGGAGYGGKGGDGSGGKAGGSAYGSADAPSLLGSGGGNSGITAYEGGAGGGRIKLDSPTGSIIIDGTMSTNGGNGSGWGAGAYTSGGGSGGSIWLIADSLAGTGTISANGGNGYDAGWSDAGGGAGGRVCLARNEDNFTGTVEVNGGMGPGNAEDGEDGTVYLTSGGTQLCGGKLKPMIFRFSQNYPNPFVKFTTIKYQIPIKSKVSLKIYDVTGRCVKTLIDGEKSIGYYKVKWDGEGLSTGIYFAKFKAGDYKETKKLILMR